MRDPPTVGGATISPTGRLIVVTGGNGFIGSHVAKLYLNRGYQVRVVDNNSISKMDDHPFYTERIIGNLCDRSFCQHVVRGAHAVLHFAAVMGGMGVIHSDNDDIIYQANHEMTQNILVAASQAGVHTFFYASSACVYPIRLQTGHDDSDVSLREADAYGHYGESPQPQHLYGLEKLNSENLALRYKDRMNIRIGRFHNVYGPRGSWDDGHEKVPAAFMRKALAIKHLGDHLPTFEVWGDGQQRRSFLYIDDAVQAISLLVDSTVDEPINIGSDQSVSIIDLAKLSLQLAGLDPSLIRFTFQDKPVGVASRNSNNELSTQCLSWAPRTPHSKGLSELRDWIDAQMQKEMMSKDEVTRQDYLRCLLTSRVINLNSENLVRFAVLLPVTSRPDPPKCIENLKVFARSLSRTTWRDRNELCSTRYEVRIYLAIDHDDKFLLPPTAGSDGRAESVLRQHGLSNIITIPCHYPKGYVCALWRDCARRAFQDQCDYYLLMGDDVELLDEGWMRSVHEKFFDISQELQTPFGFGCVAFTDVSFPGMPTFPTVHRTHMQIFNGEVIPEDFINQDGDPYLFQLYRHFGASTTVSVRLHNSIGGTNDARYVKQSLSNWTFEPLELGKVTVREWANKKAPSLRNKLSLDVIVPSYRVDLERLSKILSLKSSSTCTTMFIVIIDDPSSPYIDKLEKDYGQRMDVRIRVNKGNLGASASRNRGLTESSAEWVAFLDDDVDPSTEYLIAAERYIREHPDAAGFVGNSFFPVAHNIFTAAVHLAGVTFFWDIASKIAEDVPWGVTANLIVRRNIRDNVQFDLIFPKTGGGEDIDYCRQKRRASLERGGTAFWAAPDAMVTHPWWNGGRRSYRRFYRWAKGDGALIHMYPELSWRDSTPNGAESLLLAGCAVICGVFSGIVKRDWLVLQFGIALAISTVLVHVFHDAYRHLIRHRDRAAVIKTTIGPIPWVLAVLEGGLIRMASEMGRLVGVLERHEWGSVGKRFDWFTGGPWGIVEERSGGVERFVCIIGLCALMMGLASD